MALTARAFDACRAAGTYVGISCQGPSDKPTFARWLVERGIDTISLDPDTVLEAWLQLGDALAPNVRTCVMRGMM